MSCGSDCKVRTYPHKCGMIHLGRTIRALMLNVASAAVLDLRVKRGWLFPEVDSGGGMARDTCSSLHTFRRRVT